MMARWWLLIAGAACWGLAGLVLAGKERALRPNAAAAVPQRIVSLAPNLTEILFALGEGDRVVAVTNHCNWPAAAQARAKVGTFWQPNLESIVKAGPDLVVALDMAQQRIVTQRLERMGYRCLSLRIETVGQLMEALSTLGKGLGCSDAAAALRTSLTQRLARAGEGSGSRPSVLWVVQRRPLRVAGQRSFIQELIELAGGRNALGPTIYPYPPIGAEQVAACQPRVIIEPVSKAHLREKDEREAMEFWSRMPSIPAVTDGRVFLVDADLVSRLGPRIVDGVDQISRCLRAPVGHPLSGGGDSPP
jgi:iron complex transport system substrate-binding protein